MVLLSAAVIVVCASAAVWIVILAVRRLLVLNGWTDARAFHHNEAELSRALGSAPMTYHHDHSRPLNVLLVFAHPDDEAMFFAPLLVELSRIRPTSSSLQPFNFTFLCLSSGDAAGLGDVRVAELIQSAEFFQNIWRGSSPITDRMAAAQAAVTIIRDPSLKDGMDTVWDVELIRRLVMIEVEARHCDVVFTFDEIGISSHPNHRATFQGVKLACRTMMKGNNKETRPPRFFSLISRPFARKFVSVLSLMPYVAGSSSSTAADSAEGSARGFSVIVPRSKAAACRMGLACHASQLVWFRKIFVILATYSFLNEFREIN